MDYSLIEAPSSLGLAVRGVEGLPKALLDQGLAEALGASRFGLADPPQAQGGGPSAGRVRNAEAIAAYSPVLADMVGAAMDERKVPLLLGGDCTILLGSALALRRRGRFGLLFIDGHADFYTPETEPNGEAASMDLALATGLGPRLLADMEGRAPYFRSEDVVAFGFRDVWADPEYAQPDLPSDMRRFDLRQIQELGLGRAGAEAMAHLVRTDGPEKFLVHLDVDVLDDRIMPAVDYRMEGGLTFAELSHLLSIAVATERVAAVEIAIFNPSLDTDGQIAADLTSALVEGLAGASRSGQGAAKR